MRIQVAPYLAQVDVWPSEGRRILAQFDDESIIVYQAYRPEIGHFAARNGYFGGAFKLTRMSWLKPNFLWMMYRSGWSQKQGQEVILAVRLQRRAFDEFLARAVHSTFKPEVYGHREAWRRAVADSDVRLQFDPDHDPYGGPLPRRAIQLGLRGEALAKYARDWIVDIEDVSEFTRAQYEHVRRQELHELRTPAESVYVVADRAVRERLQLDD